MTWKIPSIKDFRLLPITIHGHSRTIVFEGVNMVIKKRVLEKKKMPDARQTRVKKERRATPRSKPQKKQAKAKIDYSGNDYAPGIVELSHGGCKIMTDAELKVGDIVTFKTPAATRGRVVWSHMGFYGIEFID